MPEFIALKAKSQEEYEQTGENLNSGHVYQHIGDSMEDVLAVIANGDLGIGDKIYYCEEIAVVEGRLKYTKK